MLFSLYSLSNKQSEGLRNYFSEFGKVDACIVQDADGKLRGFAFLTFDDPASVNAVMIRDNSQTERPSVLSSAVYPYL